MAKWQGKVFYRFQLNKALPAYIPDEVFSNI